LSLRLLQTILFITLSQLIKPGWGTQWFVNAEAFSLKFDHGCGRIDQWTGSSPIARNGEREKQQICHISQLRPYYPIPNEKKILIGQIR
jgi:hypothetical protein